MQKQTTAQYSQWLEKNNSSIELLGEYCNSHTKTEHRCKVCSNEWPATPTSIKQGKGCPHCAVNAKKTSLTVLQKRLDKFYKERTVLHRQDNNMIRILCSCGREYSQSNGCLRKGSDACNYCNGTSLEALQNKLDQSHTGRTVIDKSRDNNLTILNILCSCGRAYSQNSGHIQWDGCKHCNSGTSRGFDESKPGLFYVLRNFAFYQGLWQPVYKIGITNKSLKERYSPEQAWQSGWHVVYCSRKTCGYKVVRRESEFKKHNRRHLLKSVFPDAPKMFKRTCLNEVYTVKPDCVNRHLSNTPTADQCFWSVGKTVATEVTPLMEKIQEAAA